MNRKTFLGIILGLPLAVNALARGESKAALVPFDNPGHPIMGPIAYPLGRQLTKRKSKKLLHPDGRPVRIENDHFV